MTYCCILISLQAVSKPFQKNFSFPGEILNRNKIHQMKPELHIYHDLSLRHLQAMTLEPLVQQ